MLLEPGRELSQLGVTATVVRPAEIAPFPSGTDGSVARIRNTAAIEVIADGGTVRQLDEETTAVTSDKAGPVTVTLVF